MISGGSICRLITEPVKLILSLPKQSVIVNIVLALVAFLRNISSKQCFVVESRPCV